MRGHSILFSAVCWLLFGWTAAATVFYVDVNSANPTLPYTNWSIAATDIQSAINAARSSDLVLVTNGIYQTGGSSITDPSNIYGASITSRIRVSTGVTVSSVNGPGATIIKGGSPYACACLLGNAMLSGFTLTNGNSQTFGGGAYCQTTNAVISNCLICSNYSFRGGGGVYLGTLNSCIISNNFGSGGGGGILGSVANNCIIINNKTQFGGSARGGGAQGNVGIPGPGDSTCILNNCVLIGNAAYEGGGAYGCVINNSLITSNYASYFGGGGISNQMNNCVITYNSCNQRAGSWNSTMTNCTLCFNIGYMAITGCTFRNCILYDGKGPTAWVSLGNTLMFCCTESLQYGTGNIAAQPLFVNTNLNDFHLQSNSPCINAGNNAFVSSTNDFDGNPRIVGGTADIGAYEYQTPSSVLSYAWAQQYGLPTDGTADYTDGDGDGLSNWQEWIAGTIPTNSASVLVLASPSNSVSGLTVTWQSVNTRTYYLQSSTNIPTFTSIQSNLVGQAGTTSFTDATATNGGPYFYRVGVQ